MCLAGWVVGQPSAAPWVVHDKESRTRPVAGLRHMEYILTLVITVLSFPWGLPQRHSVHTPHNSAGQTIMWFQPLVQTHKHDYYNGTSSTVGFLHTTTETVHGLIDDGFATTSTVCICQ